MDSLELLAATPMFEGLPAAELEPLRASVRSRHYAKDDYLFREGDPGSHLFLIVAGQVKIARVAEGGSEVVFAIAGPGELFGELSLFEEEGERSADAQALEPTDCLVVPRQPVLALLTAHPRLLLRIVASLSAYVRRKDAAVAEVAFLDIPARVARKLLELAESKGRSADGGTVIDVHLSQRTLAGMVGASRENVNRALHRFTSLGYIRQERGLITVLRPDELRKRGSSPS
jgi:CRP/FNR family transcriptional regulator/CRP/FNR family cyclic AMP-dependent transcriptional regulator